MSEFKDIVCKLRAERNWTQPQLASELKISKSTVAMWETGDRFPSKDLYEQLGDLFNVDIDYLYGRTDIRKKIHFDNDGTAYVPQTVAAHLDTNDLTEDELDDVANYIELVKKRRNK